jgi:hypothetical protein
VLPYIAIPVGSTGLPVAAVVAPLILLSIGGLGHRPRGFAALAIVGWFLLGLSLLLNGLSSQVVQAASYRSWGLLATIPAVVFSLQTVRIWADRDAVILGAAIGILGHGALAAAQVWGFAQGSFPALSLFALNPSFEATYSASTNYALYVRRPMGWFPEPSAAVAVMIPWACVFVGRLCLQREHRMSRAAVFVLAASIVAVVATSVVGRSGFILVAAPVVAAAVVSHLRSPRGRKWLMASIAVGVLAFGWASSQAALSGVNLQVDYVDRFNVANQSWQYRYATIASALREMADGSLQSLYGRPPGSGLSSELGLGAQTSHASTPIYSVVVQFLHGTGLFGLSLLLWGVYVGVRTVLRWHRSVRPKGVSAGWWGVSAAALALLGLSLSTSYPLLGAWAVLIAGGWPMGTSHEEVREGCGSHSRPRMERVEDP